LPRPARLVDERPQPRTARRPRRPGRSSLTRRTSGGGHLELIENRVAGDELYDPRQAQAERFVARAAGKLEGCYEERSCRGGLGSTPIAPVISRQEPVRLLLAL